MTEESVISTIACKALGRNYRIAMDTKQFLLQKKGRSKDGSVLWLNIGYYMNLASLIQRVSYLKTLSKSRRYTLKSYLKEYRSTLNAIQKELGDVSS